MCEPIRKGCDNKYANDEVHGEEISVKITIMYEERCERHAIL